MKGNSLWNPSLLRSQISTISVQDIAKILPQTHHVSASPPYFCSDNKLQGPSVCVDGSLVRLGSASVTPHAQTKSTASRFKAFSIKILKVVLISVATILFAWCLISIGFVNTRDDGEDNLNFRHQDLSKTDVAVKNFRYARDESPQDAITTTELAAQSCAYDEGNLEYEIKGVGAWEKKGMVFINLRRQMVYLEVLVEKQLEAVGGEPLLEKFFSFTVVREPMQRGISAFYTICDHMGRH
ncbi:unnamed protein product, partial [Choristocarpus tenellus]